MEGMEKMESLDGQYDRIKASDVAKKALLARRRLSLRLQICASFFVVFLVAAIAAYVLSEANTQVEKKLNFLEIANDFTVEIIQARRFEKNFFLYDTNLDDALENVYQARAIFDKNTGELVKVLGRDSYNKLMSGLNHYGEILERLLAQEKGNRL